MTGTPRRKVGFGGRQGWVGAWGLPCSATLHPPVTETPRTAPSIAGKRQVTASSGQSCFSRCRRGNLGEAPGHLRQLTQTKPEHGPRLPRCRMFSKQVALWGREVESFISKTKVHSANQDYKEQGKRSQQQLCPLSAEFALGHKEQIDNYCSNSFP